MKLPQPFAGWVSSMGKAHTSYDEAMGENIRAEMTSVLNSATISLSSGFGYNRIPLTPGDATEIILKHFNVSPKVTE